MNASNSFHMLFKHVYSAFIVYLLDILESRALHALIQSCPFSGILRR